MRVLWPRRFNCTQFNWVLIFVQQTGRFSDRRVAKLAAVGERPDAALMGQCWHSSFLSWNRLRASDPHSVQPQATMLFTITDYPAYELLLNSTVETCRREQHEQWRALLEYSCSDQRPRTDWFPDFKCGPVYSTFQVWGPFIFYGVVGAGGIWRKAPVEYDDPPPLHQKIFTVPPFFPKIIEMTPPPSKKKTNKQNKTKNEKTEKERFLFLFVNVDTFFIEFNSWKKNTNIWRIKGVAIRAVKFEAARIHFLGDVFDAVAVFVA